MTEPLPRDVFLKVRKLGQLPEQVRQSRWAVSITRLTTLKTLCQDAGVANRFVTYLARKTLERVERGHKRAERLPQETTSAHREMMAEALGDMEAWNQAPTEARRQRLQELRQRIEAEQNEYEPIKWGSVRLIHDADLLLFEYALHCLLEPRAAGHWAYQTARHYAERYDSRYGTGLIPESAPLVQDIVDFWTDVMDIDLSAIPTPAGQGTRQRKSEEQARSESPSGRAGSRKKKSQGPTFTHRQGQFLAFIHLYRKLHRQGPAELDMVKCFRVTPPSVHSMVVKLEELGLVTREPGVARSVRVAIPEEEIPDLENVGGPPW